MTRPLAYLLVLLLLLPLKGKAEQITVASASNFTQAMELLIAEFESLSDHSVQTVYGSSGRLYAQIINGAPFDVFFSADQDKAERLEAEGLIAAGSRFTYAIGALVLWSKEPGLMTDNAEVLRRGEYRKLALANPRLAPYGVAAVEVLQRLGLTESSRDRWILGENIAQTFQFVDTANAELGFVALSQVLVDDRLQTGSGWIVPTELYTPIRQDVVLLNRTDSEQAAREFLDFIRSDTARAIIESYGYRVENAP